MNEAILRKCGESGQVKAEFFRRGQSLNIIYALQAAREIGMLTIGFAGMEGGKFSEVADYCFVVLSF